MTHSSFSAPNLDHKDTLQLRWQYAGTKCSTITHDSYDIASPSFFLTRSGLCLFTKFALCRLMTLQYHHTKINLPELHAKYPVYSMAKMQELKVKFDELDRDRSGTLDHNEVDEHQASHSRTDG